MACARPSIYSYACAYQYVRLSWEGASLPSSGVSYTNRTCSAEHLQTTTAFRWLSYLCLSRFSRSLADHRMHRSRRTCQYFLSLHIRHAHALTHTSSVVDAWQLRSVYTLGKDRSFKSSTPGRRSSDIYMLVTSRRFDCAHITT